MSPIWRLFLLLACIAAGLIVGWIGHRFTGESAWYLAIPAAIAVAWLFVADPSKCTAADHCRRSGPGA